MLACSCQTGATDPSVFDRDVLFRSSKPATPNCVIVLGREFSEIKAKLGEQQQQAAVCLPVRYEVVGDEEELDADVTVELPETHDGFIVRVRAGVLHSLQKHLKRLPEFTVKDLCGVNPKDVQLIDPIFIPSKVQTHTRLHTQRHTHQLVFQGRASDKSDIRANLLCHEERKRVYLKQDHGIVFVVNEAHEVEEYQRTFGPGSPLGLTNELFFVSIPDKDRGVGFARSMIVIVQHVLRRALSELSSPPPSFD